MRLGIYRQCKLPWLFCKEIHNPRRLSRPNSPAQKLSRTHVFGSLPQDPPKLEDVSSARRSCHSLLSASLASCSPKGFPQCVINFTFSVCRRVERRLRPSSRPARPRGHQLKALIGQQYIKVAPRSGSSERQESVSWAFVSNRKIQKKGKK